MLEVYHGHLVSHHREASQMPRTAGSEHSRRRIPLEHRESVGRLRARHHVEALQLQRIAEPLREIDVALDHQDLRKIHSATAHAIGPGSD